MQLCSEFQGVVVRCEVNIMSSLQNLNCLSFVGENGNKTAQRGYSVESKLLILVEPKINVYIVGK
jgi:hypothetical protein